MVFLKNTTTVLLNQNNEVGGTATNPIPITNTNLANNSTIGLCGFYYV